MKVTRAATAGFCMGVNLALRKLETAINNQEKKEGGRVRTLGPIIHNPQALEQFARRGVVCLACVEDVRSGDCVVIRAHGIPRQEEKALRQRCLHVKDATCPKVKKAQLSIAKATKNGAFLLLFGEERHPEVAGLVSYALGPARVFDSFESLSQLRLETSASYVLASQTTQDKEAFEAIAASLRSRLPRLELLSTICGATKERQEEAIEIASHSDVMVVAGGKASGNTTRLAMLARQAGAPVFHVETASELRPEDFKGARTVGLTAGASTPKEIIDSIEAALLSFGEN